MTNEEVITYFNENIRPSVERMYGPDDTVAINESFNDWTDGLCKDGIITQEQYNTITLEG